MMQKERQLPCQLILRCLTELIEVQIWIIQAVLLCSQQNCISLHTTAELSVEHFSSALPSPANPSEREAFNALLSAASPADADIALAAFADAEPDLAGGGDVQPPLAAQQPAIQEQSLSHDAKQLLLVTFLAKHKQIDFE